MKYIINNLEELNKFAVAFARSIRSEDVYSLIGDLGAGKTTLVQMIGSNLGIDDYITSPTFSLVNMYSGTMNLNHLDLYRLEDPSELEAIDFENYFYPDGVTFIEWAEKGGDYIPEDIIEIGISVKDGIREIEIIKNSQRAMELERDINESISH